MDTNQLLGWMVLASAVVTIVRAARFGDLMRGWIAVSFVAIILYAAASWFRPAIAGYIVVAFWLLFSLTPMILQRIAQRRVNAQDFRGAQRWSRVAAWLHPLDGWLEQPDLLRGLELARAGQLDEAIAIFERVKTTKGSIGRSATLQLLRVQDRWPELVEWIDRNFTGDLTRDPVVLILLLRALGELGATQRLVDTLRAARTQLESAMLGAVRAQVLFVAFSFTGKRAALEKLFATTLSSVAPELQKIWLATADLTAGNTEAGHRVFEELRSSPDAVTRRLAERRFNVPLPIADALLDAPGKALLSELEREADHEQRYRPQLLQSYRAPMSIAIVVANAVLFAIEETSGGSTDMDTLYRLGAMVPSAIRRGEVWRLLASTFLHYGWLHITLNMAGLLLFGPFIERNLGRLRFAIIYFVSGVGSMLFLSAIAARDNEIAVGASGAIMGLFGAAIAVLLRAWRKDRARIAKNQLRVMLLIIALQVVFDLTTPHVSFIAHSAGVVIGFLVAIILAK